MRARSIFTSRERGAVLGLFVALLVGAVGLAPAHAAAAFNPVLTASNANDAARAATAFSLKITQADREEQIGTLSISVPRDPGFTLDTDLPGNGTQIGTIHVVLYTNPRPATLTVDGTLTDNNQRANCGPGSSPSRQCIQAHLNVAGVQVDADLEIYENPTAYSITGDLTSTWASDEASVPDLRLKELSTSLASTVGSHTVVKNPDTADTWPLTYAITSASVPSRGLTGGLHPLCGGSCQVPLTTREYAPTVPALNAPTNSSVHLTTQPVDFVWKASVDANNDPITYALEIDGQDPISVDAPTTHALVSLGAGTYSWKVTASANGDTVSSVVRKVTVIDPDGTDTYRFVSTTNGDKLFIDPVQHVFVYQRANNGALNGAKATSAVKDRGYIVFNTGFTLTIAYDHEVGTAAGLFLANDDRREFVDPPGP